MTTCSRNFCSFCLPCVSFQNVYQFECAFVSFFSFEGMGSLIESISDYCLSFYFDGRCKPSLTPSHIILRYFNLKWHFFFLLGFFMYIT